MESSDSGTGARPEEIFRLRIEDIHWDERWIFNRCGKTKNSKRYLPISDRMLPLLQARAKGEKEGWVFPSKSKCGHLTTVAKGFARARELAGLPKTVVLYSARHTFGTTVLEETHNPAVTMKAMGHGSARMMMRYQHPEYVEAVRLAINRRNESLNGFGPTLGPTQACMPTSSMSGRSFAPMENSPPEIQIMSAGVFSRSGSAVGDCRLEQAGRCWRWC